MQLPVNLQKAIESITESFGIHKLIQAREELTQRYLQPSGSEYITTDAHRHAYVFSRLPATYSAVQGAIRNILTSSNFHIQSVLDLGAGPGTAMWAACENFPDVKSAMLMEKDSGLISIGKNLAQFSENSVLQQADWKKVDLEKLVDLPLADLIILSYSIGELKPDKMLPFMELCWKSTNQILLMIEPGTPPGFERIRSIRQELLKWGAHLIAPCPHHDACPMSDGDWCHFSSRVERSSIHRRIKEGTLSYEDEKFSYLAVAKSPVPLPSLRVLRHPMRHSGHVNLRACTALGLQQVTISKKRGELYKKARKVEWGDSFSIEVSEN